DNHPASSFSLPRAEKGHPLEFDELCCTTGVMAEKSKNRQNSWIWQNSPQFYSLIQRVGAERILPPLHIGIVCIFGAKPDRSGGPGGTVAVESAVGTRSTFRVWVPIDLSATHPAD